MYSCCNVLPRVWITAGERERGSPSSGRGKSWDCGDRRRAIFSSYLVQTGLHTQEFLVVEEVSKTADFQKPHPPGHLGTMLPPLIAVKAVSQRWWVVSYAMGAKWGAKGLISGYQKDHYCIDSSLRVEVPLFSTIHHYCICTIIDIVAKFTGRGNWALGEFPRVPPLSRALGECSRVLPTQKKTKTNYKPPASC